MFFLSSLTSPPLAGQDDLVPLAGFFQPGADDLFGTAVSFPDRRYRIHLGGIDQIHAGVQGVIQLGMGFPLAILMSPGHSAQADFADPYIGVPQAAVFHRR